MREETAITNRMVTIGFITLAVVIGLIFSLLSRPTASATEVTVEDSSVKRAHERAVTAFVAAQERERLKAIERANRAAARKAAALEAARKAAAEKKAREAASKKKASQTPAKVAASGSVWDRLAQCESGGRWNYNGSSGYDGGLQFLPSTWRSFKPSGYPDYAWQASREQQIVVAKKVLASSGWGAWPACARKLGLR